MIWTGFSERPSIKIRLGWGAALVLFALNVWIAHRLFALEFTPLQSNEAAFIAISRFFRDHWTDLRWFPWFDAGMPIENAYQPVLPATTALLDAVTRWPIGRAFHIVLALAYCLGPVTLCWFVVDWSESPAQGFIAGLLYSLISPAVMLFPTVRTASDQIVPGGAWNAQRLINLVYYGEDPHVLELTLLPVALLFLRRSIMRGDRKSFAGAVVSCAAVVLTNAFGAPALALGALCIVLALNTAGEMRRGAARVIATGVVAWCLSSPWLTPSLIKTIRDNAFTPRGQYDEGVRAYVAAAAAMLVFGVLWLATRRLTSSFERFVWLFAVWMCAFPALYYWKHITLVPQPHRYELELEMGLCLLLGALSFRLIDSGRVLRAIGIVALAVLAIHQGRVYLNIGHTLIKPLDITKTVEYAATKWIDRNLPGQRTMVSGDAAWVFNVFSDNSQMSAGHEPTAPNFIQQIAVYQIYSGAGAGARDAEVALVWLKAFGNQAVTVPGPASREVYKPFTNADKFAGVLPVLWHDGGDTIYAIPQRSRSLAHVIPAEAVVKRRPVNGMDVEPLKGYADALEDATIPEAGMNWRGESQVYVKARVMPGQVIAVQESFDTAWEARVRGQRRPVRSDGLGLMIIDTGCAGDCEVELTYGTTAEVWICRFLSSLACVLLLGLLI